MPGKGSEIFRSLYLYKECQNIFGVKNRKTEEPVDENTIFAVCSLSKPVFAYFILKLAHRLVLDLTTPLYTCYMDKDEYEYGYYY